MAKESSEINPAGIKICRNSQVPLYVQVYEQFREMILSKRLRPGDRVPASRNLALETGVSRVIINQAYEQLMMEGYLVGRTGSGTFVSDTVPDILLHAGMQEGAKSDSKGPTPDTSYSATGSRLDIEPFQIGTPSLDQFPFKIWQQVGTRVLKELKGTHVGYEDTLGYMPLRKAVAAYLRISRAVKCEAEQVIIVTGSLQGLNLTIKSLLEKGDEVWMEDPGYPGAKDSFLDAGVTICPVPICEDGLDIDLARQKYAHAKMAYITPSHQFPLGYTLSQNKRLELLEWARLKDMWILEDDYDSEFRYEGQPLESLQGLDKNGRVIYSGTFSKTLFPGLRLAYIVVPSRDMIPRFRKIKNNLDRQSPILEQLIVTRFIEEGHFLRHIRKMRLLYADRKNVLVGLLKASLREYLQIIPSSSGMHLVCWLSDKIDADKLKKEIKSQKLIVSFISNFTVQSHMKPAITLGYTAFSKYKLKIAVEKLTKCIHRSLRE